HRESLETPEPTTQPARTAQLDTGRLVRPQVVASILQIRDNSLGMHSTAIDETQRLGPKLRLVVRDDNELGRRESSDPEPLSAVLERVLERLRRQRPANDAEPPTDPEAGQNRASPDGDVELRADLCLATGEHGLDLSGKRHAFSEVCEPSSAVGGGVAL